NNVCHARWYHHTSGEARPAIVFLHGWGAGQFHIESRAYPADWFYGKGLDVLYVTLPFHARRKPVGRRTPMFPSSDPVRSNEGFAQAVLDVRSAIRFLYDQGAPAVGLSGMSLGGFTTALTATIDTSLAFAMPVIPFSSLPDLILHHGEQSEAMEKAREEGLEPSRYRAAFAAVDVFSRRPTVDAESVLIAGAERDLVTPIVHAERLHGHFAGSTLHRLPGAHVVQVGRSALFRRMVSFLEERKILPGS
ncbi:MAG: hypothetical protein KC561_15500, partial [Myxococcales bacterium]|nr:hypothetical protein [Myxococcales bacterium]